MTTLIPQLNQKFSQSITGTSVIFGYTDNLKTKTEYILIDYEGAAKDSGATPMVQELRLRAEAFTKSTTNAYAIFTLAKKVLDVLKHKIKLANGEVVEFTRITSNYFDVEVGKKAEISATVKFWR